MTNTEQINFDYNSINQASETRESTDTVWSSVDEVKNNINSILYKKVLLDTTNQELENMRADQTTVELAEIFYKKGFLQANNLDKIRSFAGIAAINDEEYELVA